MQKYWTYTVGSEHVLSTCTQSRWNFDKHPRASGSFSGRLFNVAGILLYSSERALFESDDLKSFGA